MIAEGLRGGIGGPPRSVLPRLNQEPAHGGPTERVRLRFRTERRTVCLRVQSAVHLSLY